MEEDKQPKELKFIELREDIVLNNLKIPAYTRLPILTESKETKGSVEIDKNAIILGLAYAVRKNLENEDIAYFKKILLNDSTIVDRLTEQVKKFDKSIDGIRKNLEVLELLCALQESEISFINYSKSLINLIQYEEEENKIEDMEDKLFETLKKGLTLFPESYSLLFHMADYHKNVGNFETAEKYIKKLKDSNNFTKEAQKLEKDIIYYKEKEQKILYIYDLINLNRVDDAVKKCDEFLKDEKDDWHVHFLLGWAKRLQQDYEAAEKSLLESIKCGGGEFAENFNELSLVAWNLEKKELAVKYSEMAFDLDDKSITYASNTALMYLEIKDYENAYTYLCRTYFIDKNDDVLKGLIGRYENETKEKFAYPKNLSEEHKTHNPHEDCEGHKHD